MIVARLAQARLDPAVGVRCDALIATTLGFGSSSNNIFVTASCWADDYKTQLGTGIWHYLDIPFSLDGTTTAGVAPDPWDAVRAIRQQTELLRATTSSETQKATALRYLIHLVGDLQQPMHCSTAVWAGDTNGDAGGNGFAVTGTWSNLHSLWDAGGGAFSDSISRPLNSTELALIDTRAAEIESLHPYATLGGGSTDPMDWAVEGMAIARDTGYVGVTRNATPSTTYLNKVKASAKQRAAMGGRRLADLLNTTLAATPVSVSRFEAE